MPRRVRTTTASPLPVAGATSSNLEPFKCETTTGLRLRMGVSCVTWIRPRSSDRLLFRNLNGSKFEEVAPATGAGWPSWFPHAAAFGDLFNDGHTTWCST